MKKIIQTPAEFLYAVYGSSPAGYLTIWNRQNKKTEWIQAWDRDKASKTIARLNKDKDVYFGVGLRKEKLEGISRGSTKDVIALPALYADIDLYNKEAHKESELPPDFDTARSIYSKLNLKPTMVINSGNGIYPLWIFKDLWVFKDDTERDQAQELMDKFHNVLSALFREHDYKLDNVSDLARVLRVPFTKNYKTNPPKESFIIEYDPDAKYSLTDINNAIEETSLVVKPVQKSIKAQSSKPKVKTEEQESQSNQDLDKFDYSTASADLVIKRCKFLEHCVKDAENLPQPDWYFGLIGVLSFTQEAPEVIHKLSSPYPDYSEPETQSKIEQVEKFSPTTCKKIQEQCGTEYCKKCKYDGLIKSPIILGETPTLSLEPHKTEPFPVDTLPQAFQKYTKEASKSIGCPPDYVALPLLTYAGGLIGNSASIKLSEDWTESAIIYSALIGDPSAKKSPPLGKVTAFIEDIQNRNMQIYRELKEKYDSDYKFYDLEYKKWQKDYERGKASRDNMPVAPEAPIAKQFYTADTTVEALVELMVNHPKGIIIGADELTGFLRGFNQYKGGKGNDKAFYLSCFTNKGFVLNRKGKEPLSIKKTFLSIIGGIQPDLINELKGDLKARDGFIERFLFAYPEKVTNVKFSTESISTESKKALQECFSTLYIMNHEVELPFELNNEAKRLFENWYNEIYSTIKRPEFDKTMDGYYTKMIAYTARLALILHCVKAVTHECEFGYIDEVSVQNAIDLSKYFLSQANKVMCKVENDAEKTLIQKFKVWISKHADTTLKKQFKRPDIITKRVICSYRVAGCENSVQAGRLLELARLYGLGVWSSSNKFILFPTAASADK